MSEAYLRQPGFTYSAWNHLLLKKKEYKNWRYIYQNELDKASFEHDTDYGDSKNLPRIITSNKLLHDKTFNLAKNKKYDGYQSRLASMVYDFFWQKVFWWCS